VVTRVVLILLATAGLVWLGTGLVAARLESEASGKLAQPGVPASQQIAHLDRRRLLAAADLFERARKWAPYQVPLTQEAALRWQAGQPRRAAHILETLLRREPENAQAWSLLSQVLASTDRARAAFARHEVQQLSPLGTR
jgi:predicted Zn-dependent protease